MGLRAWVPGRGGLEGAPGGGDGAAPPEDARAAFWDERISAWESARYSALARLNPLSWTVRRRMGAARRLVREEFRRHREVLDLGCGGGLLADAVRGDPGRRYRGIDFSAVAVAAARARFADRDDRIRFERRDVLDGGPWRAPLIVFLGLLDWLDDAEALGLFRSLDAERLLFSFTEAEDGLAGALYRQYRRRVDTRYRARSFPQARIVAAAGAAGYRVDAILRPTPWDPGRLVTASRR